MHSEYTAPETPATCVANLADLGSAVRKQARAATGRTPFSSVHPKQARRSGDHCQSAPLVVALVLAVVFGLLPALYAWAVRSMLHRTLRRLREGDFEPLFRTYAGNIKFVFPGHNSWAGEFRGKAEVKRWVRRVYQVGLRLEPHEILVMGPPWNTTVCLRFTDRCTAPDGTIVYTNRGMVFGKIAWGKITSYEIHEDTEKVVELDEYVASHEPTGA
jgi:ketosteroid isomerase-like protein